MLSVFFADAAFAQTRIGVAAGLDVSNITTVTDKISTRRDWHPGFQAGVGADFGDKNTSWNNLNIAVSLGYFFYSK